MVHPESSSDVDLEELELEEFEEGRGGRFVKEEGALGEASPRREKLRGYRMKEDRSRVTWDRNSTLELITRMVAYEVDCREAEGSDAHGKEWSRRYKRWETIAKAMKNPRGYDLEKLRKSCQARFTSLCLIYRGKNVNKKLRVLNAPTLKKLTEYFNLFPANRFKQREEDEDAADMDEADGEDLPRRLRGRPRKTTVAETEGPKTGSIPIETRKSGSASVVQSPVNDKQRMPPMPVQVHQENASIRKMEATICWLRSWVKVNILPVLNNTTSPSMSEKEMRRIHEECAKLRTDQLNDYLVEARSGNEYIQDHTDDSVLVQSLPNRKDQLSDEILKIAAAMGTIKDRMGTIKDRVDKIDAAKIEQRLSKLENSSGVRQAAAEIPAPIASPAPSARPAPNTIPVPVAVPASVSRPAPGESSSLVASTSAIDAPPGHTVIIKFC